MNLANHFPLVVAASESGLRFDQVLSTRFPEVSRNRWIELINRGVFFSQGRALKASHRVRENETINCEKLGELQIDAKLVLEQSEFIGAEPEVLFEDSELIVLAKPAGLAVHPGSGVGLNETLAGWLLATGRVKLSPEENSHHLSWNDELLEEQRPGIVHRLDRGTSGVMVAAKNPLSHAVLSKQFADRVAGRFYWALIYGDILELSLKRTPKLSSYLERAPSPIALKIAEKGELSFAAYLDRDPGERTRFRVSPEGKGKRSLTHVRVHQKASPYSLLELKLDTGRTHQIRVHLSFLGYPIVGDTLYGGRSFGRIMLHAHSLFFEHPITNELMRFSAPWPSTDAAWLSEQGFTV